MTMLSSDIRLAVYQHVVIRLAIAMLSSDWLYITMLSSDIRLAVYHHAVIRLALYHHVVIRLALYHHVVIRLAITMLSPDIRLAIYHHVVIRLAISMLSSDIRLAITMLPSDWLHFTMLSSDWLHFTMLSSDWLYISMLLPCSTGTWESILVVDQEGNHLQTFQYQPTETASANKPEQLDCFLLVNEEVTHMLTQSCFVCLFVNLPVWSCLHVIVNLPFGVVCLLTCLFGVVCLLTCPLRLFSY